MTLGATGEATYRNYDFKELKGSLTGPGITDRLALRLSAFYNDRDGNYRNLFEGNFQNGGVGWGIRGQPLATPTQFLTIRLTGTNGGRASRPSRR